MASEKRLIDANALENFLADNYGYPVVDILGDLAKFPTVDAVEVIRCENCASHVEEEDCPKGRVWCKTMCRYIKKDGYCSFGGRRSNEPI